MDSSNARAIFLIFFPGMSEGSFKQAKIRALKSSQPTTFAATYEVHWLLGPLQMMTMGITRFLR
jgi:hypothetical protein